MARFHQPILSAASAFVLAAVAIGSPKQKPIDEKAAAFFETRVRPILADRCFECHSDATSAKGGLKLDSLAGLLKGGKRGPALSHGTPEESRILHAIRYDDPMLRMPPTGKLTAEEIAALTAWVKQGSPWPETLAPLAKPSVAKGKQYWAFVPLKAPNIPVVKDTRWAQSPLDKFVLAGLEANGLKPAQPADRIALIRRATFDLTGLPPTPDEVHSFLADTKPGAYLRVIDRLLATPAYGERWGRHWLDVARYADSNGLDENLVYTQAWRYRDYVVRAFNQDKPISRFIQEQIAGDLLPAEKDESAEHDRIIATGYLSLGPKMLAEDDPVKQEMDVIDEQIDTLGKTFLGLTIGCARCHDHKFDPFPQTDYYALAGIFKSTKTMLNYKNMAEWQEIPLASAEDRAKLAAVDSRLSTLRNDREQFIYRNKKIVLDEATRRFGDYQKAVHEFIAMEKASGQLVAAITSPNGPAPTGSLITEAEDFTEGNVQKDRDGFGKGIGVLVNIGKYPNRTKYDFTLPVDGAYQLDIRYASGDPRPIRLYVNGALVKANATSKTTGGFYPDHQRWFAEGVYAFKSGKNTVVFERDSYFPHIDRFLLIARPGQPVTSTSASVATEHGLNAELLAVLVERVKSAKRDDLIREDLELDDKPERVFAGDVRKSLAEIDARIATAEKERPKLPRAMAVSDGKPVDLKVQLRGNYLTLGANCARRFPEVLGGTKLAAIPADRSGRLELAQWMTKSDHPLTARVFVNRVWRWHFGKGIVGSTDNFGTLGERPTNQSLLDWLAATFAQNGWSLKQLHRMIMTSSTYQMSSRFDSKSAEKDPENRLLWRMSRRRLEAEEIRDSILAVGGGLDRTIGGSLLKFRDREYVTSTANSDPVNYTSPRRSLYLPVVRSALYDVYTAFDFGDPTVMNGDRPTTTVAPQALFMMNSSVVLESTKALATDLLKRTELDDTARVAIAYERCYARLPTPAETKRALETLSKLDAAYAEADPKMEGRRLKCWQSLCKTLFSASEFIHVD